MNSKTAVIFGENEYAFEIKKNIESGYEKLYIFGLDKDSEHCFDLSDNWDDLRTKVNISECTVFCVLEDIAQNVFLTISLRDTFPDLSIVALSSDKESADKLLLAGATRVLPSIETTANIIVDMLEKPIITEVFHNILYEKSALKIAQITMHNSSFLDGKSLSNIEWSREHGIVIISVVHEDSTHEFIYSSHLTHNIIKSGDTFVVVGYDTDIKAFEKLIGMRNED